MSDAAGVVFLVGRILFSIYFVFTGLGFHVAKSEMAEQYARSQGFPGAAVAGWPTGLWMAAGALSVALGIWPDVGLLMIGLFVTVAAVFFHRFWEVDDPMQKQTQQGFFFRNVIALGGALAMLAFLATLGPGVPYTITEPLLSF
jgi:putative oxidoreductase